MKKEIEDYPEGMRVNYILSIRGGSDPDNYWDDPDWERQYFQIEIGATDERRWQEEKRDGHSGSEARSHVFVIASPATSQVSITGVQFYPTPGDTNLLQCAQAAPTLVKIAKYIAHKKGNFPTELIWGRKVSEVALDLEDPTFWD